MISVLLDGQIFAMQGRGGISRYFVELLKSEGIIRDLGFLYRTPYKRVQTRLAIEAFPSRYRASRATQGAWPRLRGPGMVSRQWLDGSPIVHHTLYDPIYEMDFRRRLRISTVHDMIPELFPEFFTSSKPQMAKEKYARSSDIVICVSQSTAVDLQTLWGIPEDRIRVVPLGVSPSFVDSGQRGGANNLGRPFVLYVGLRSGYKNFKDLISAWRLVRARGTDVGLTCVGGGVFSETERKLMGDDLDVAHQLEASESELAGLYGKAICLVMTSLYEGFGLPALEAMCAGCPAILADAGSLPEVSGGKALLYIPGEVEHLASLIQDVCEGPSKYEEMVSQGVQRARTFSWGRTAAATARVYGELA